LHGPREGNADALEVATFLVDFATLYEVLRVKAEPLRKGYRLTRFTLYRNAKRVPPSEKLLLRRLRYESPLDVEAIFKVAAGGVAVMWLLVQIFEKIWNIPLNRRKLELEVAKLEREALVEYSGKVDLLAKKQIDWISERDERMVLDLLVRRLEESPVQVTHVDMDVVIEKMEIEPSPRKQVKSRGDADRKKPKL
jgi:hypothetical protein